ncbi:MAG: hypothetical protein Q8S54_16430 [Bacteroidota bacterium]|nr:hypothetical protein [Odoribacter sp.]MDP3644759.1 hypothetical protein [Bacteroidota bacterium]
MKNNLLIIVVICLFVFDVLLLSNTYKQKKVIENNFFRIADQDKKLIIQNDSLRDEIILLYHNNISYINLNSIIYNDHKQKILWSQFPTNKLIVVIPESLCTSCFYHTYEEMSKSLDTSLKSKICMVKSVKEISRAVLDDTAGVEFYVENGFGLEIEKYNFPYILYLDKNFKIKFIFFFDIKHPSTLNNAIKYFDNESKLEYRN